MKLAMFFPRHAVQPVAAVYDRRPFSTACRQSIGGHRPPLQAALSTALCLASLLAFTTISCLAAATLSQQIDPPEVSVGDQVTVTITVQNGAIKQKESTTLFGMLMPNPDITLPEVDGLRVVHTMNQSTSINGSSSATVIFTLVPARPGDFTIPAFDIPLQDGGALHAKPMPLHVLSGGNAPASPSLTPAPDQPPSTPPSLPAFNPNGPVVMPPNNGTAPDATANSADTATSSFTVPLESDGRPAKVFVVLTPKTMDAYVGESVPMRIDWYIREDVDAQQDSLPTIKGSDFLMNPLSIRPREDEVAVATERYHRQSWITAISAPKSGDIPLQMERATRWVKSTTTTSLGPFGNFNISRPVLAHESILSNPLTVHVHELPQEGRPAHFTGAIGQFKVTGSAQPQSVAVGEPVTLHFTVSGEGNFDYVKCPDLADDPAWKSYVPASKTDYQDDSRTQAAKTFEQAVIPQKNGAVPLPQATFGYFDPTTKQYVAVPIALPAITVTGPALATTTPAASAPASATTGTVAPQGADLTPNRLEIGSLQTSLAPVYRQPWFWAVQAGLISMLLLGALFSFWRSGSNPDTDRAERALRQHSLQQEEAAMNEAVGCGDARAFFVAARHAVQLQLGAQWRMTPEALTLVEIGRRDPPLAERLKPLFTQADEVIYSGQAGADLNLAQWELHVRRELLQPQPA